MFRQVEVQISVVVVVTPRSTRSGSGIRHVPAHIRERPVTVVRIQPVRLAGVGHEQVQIPIPIVIGPGHPAPGAGVPDSGSSGHIGKRPAPVVPEQLVRPGVGQVQIQIAVAVVVTPGGTVSGPAVVHRRGGHIREGPVSVVPEQPVRRPGVGQVQVQIAVSVVVAPRHPAPGRAVVHPGGHSHLLEEQILVQVDDVLFVVIPRQQVQVAVPVHISECHRHRTVATGSKVRTGCGEDAHAIVEVHHILLRTLVPSRNVQVAIAIDIPELDRRRCLAAGAEVPVARIEGASTVVQVDGVLLAHVGDSYVEVAVRVSVPEGHAFDPGGIGAGAEVRGAGSETARSVVEIHHVLLAVVAHRRVQIPISVNIPKQQ